VGGDDVGHDQSLLQIAPHKLRYAFCYPATLHAGYDLLRTCVPLPSPTVLSITQSRLSITQSRLSITQSRLSITQSRRSFARSSQITIQRPPR
jgi:hypothetical protein